MSAWAELVNSDGSDEHLELCNRALKEVQAEVARLQDSEVKLVLKGLLRNLTEVRRQRGAAQFGRQVDRERQRGEIEGLNIAIAAVKRRIR